ncbi:hypothetical protein SDD30_14810 [Moorella naiadis]|uniref:hypothetical protein n=1 Tax=Moorella naiadis (nom. illeg.) TaxID=3093670 RepID=UPI003D9CB709
MWRYNNYLAVSEDFIPVFSEDVDKNRKGNWKFFIPHSYMKNMMEKLIAALERIDSGNKRSLWLTGAYGTGKTFASFVIKHLLEDDLDEIEDYFQKHQIITPLWPRFKALREKKRYLIIYRSASGHITSSRRLMVEIQQAIKEQLKSRRYVTFGESIMDQLVNKLSDTSGIFNWEGAFNKYRGRFRTIASAGEIIERLRAGDARVGEQVAAVLEEEDINLVDSPAAVKAWIKEVIDSNNLEGIVFIWDEFTEFFTNNVPVTPLQELAQATADIPFYLFLVTHRALNQFTRIDDDTRKKLLDRFHNCQLEMTPVTAYRLIANVIEARPDLRNDWETKRDSLWGNVDVAVLHINMLGERVKKEELKMLAPIHPFTAYLLATISSLYSSSQRTLFQFLKKDEPGSFQWFVANYPQDNWYWLTPDYLWQYFFEDTRIETIDTVSDILSHYHSTKGSLNNQEERRVFRVMLLLTALRRQTQGAHDLLKPNFSVIKRMFVGTNLYNRVEEVADGLCSRGIMFAVPSGNDYEYIIPTTTIDHNKLQQYKQRAEASLTFEKMINAGKSDAEFAPGLQELLFLRGAARLRHPVQFVSARELKLRRERLIQGVERSYEIGLIMVVAQEDGYLNDAEDLAKELSKTHANYCILISQVAFGIKRWNEWLDYRARSWYYEEMRDSTTKRYYDTKSKNIVDEWLGAVRTSRVRAFFRGKREELAGCEAITEYLEDIVTSIYPYGPEKLSRIATLYDHAWGKTGAEIGLKVAQNIQRPYRDVVEELKNEGVWEDDELNRSIDHPLVKMKSVVDNFFATKDHVSLKQLWEALQEPPYGLMPSPIGVLLFAVLMRRYAHGYYYSDGTNSLPLNPNKLAELIDQVLKGGRLSENYTIRKMSPEGESFCRMARDVFHLTAEQTAYPEEARKNMRKMVMEIGYPLWVLAYYVQKTASSRVSYEDMQRATMTLGGILAYDLDELDEQGMKAAVEAIHPVRRELPGLLSRDRIQEGMRQFWSVHDPQLISLMTSLNLDVPQVMARLKALFNEDVYLWREERVIEKLPEVVRNLDLVDALNNLLGIVKQDLNDLRDYFRTTWFKSKFPLLCYKEGQVAEISDIIHYLYELIYRSGQALKDNRAEDLRRLSRQVAFLLSESTSLTGLLVQKFTGNIISDHEAAELYNALPDLSEATEDEVRRAIINAISQQARQKKIVNLRKRWRELTSSESPERWSEEKRVPIQWLLEGKMHRMFLARYDKLQQLSEAELDEMAGYLDDYASEFTVLHDRQGILDRFVQVAAGDYIDLVYQVGASDKLQNYVYSVLGGKVYQWPMRLNEINQVVRRWVTENYKVTAYPQILKAIETISPDDIKQFVMDLVAEDALVGARFLSAIKGKIKQS